MMFRTDAITISAKNAGQNYTNHIRKHMTRNEQIKKYKSKIRSLDKKRQKIQSKYAHEITSEMYRDFKDFVEATNEMIQLKVDVSRCQSDSISKICSNCVCGKFHFNE